MMKRTTSINNMSNYEFNKTLEKEFKYISTIIFTVLFIIFISIFIMFIKQDSEHFTNLHTNTTYTENNIKKI